MITHKGFEDLEVNVVLQDMLGNNLIRVVEGGIPNETTKVWELVGIVGVRVVEHAIENGKSCRRRKDGLHTRWRFRDLRRAVVSFEVRILRPGPRGDFDMLFGSLIVLYEMGPLLEG